MTLARVLVTGGAGFIGSHLVDRLVALGYPVTVLDNFASGSLENLEDACRAGDVRVIEGTILSRDDIRHAMDGCRSVYHLATECVRRSLGAPVDNHEVNATGTLTVLEEARRVGLRRFVYCSSSEVYGNTSSDRLTEQTLCEPVTVYGAAKFAGELYTQAYHRTYGMDTVIVRPFNAFGPREHHEGDLAEVIPRFVIRVLNGLPPVIFGDGSQGRDFTYVTDVARGLALVGETEGLVGRRINIAYGRIVTIREVAELVAQVCQRPDLTPAFLAGRPGDVFRLHADTSMARSLLGYEAEIPFEKGLERYVDWFSRTVDIGAALADAGATNWTLPETATQRGC